MKHRFLSAISYILIICTLISILAIAIPVSAFTVCDLNCDSKVNAVDVIILSTIIVGDYGNESVNKRADVNEDKKVNAVDASLMNKMIVGSYYNDKQIDGEFYSDSVSADKYTNYLSNRIEETDRDVLVGVGNNKDFGIDFTDYEDDGYIIKNSGSYVLLFGKTTTGTDMAVRKYAKAISAGEKIDMITYHNGFRVKELRIFGKDISEYTILCNNPDSENQKFAISELQRLLKIATGITLPIDYETTENDAVIEFRLSEGPELKDEGYRYFEEDGKLIIEGAVQRGCMYGVWRFLENELYWDALTCGESTLQSSDLIEIPSGIYKEEVPGTNYLYMHADYPPYWAKFKNERLTPNSAQSGKTVMTNCCHGMSSNNWTGTSESGKQICYTKKSNLENAKVNIRTYIQSMLDAGYIIGYNFHAVDISQGDNNEFCLCRVCKNVFKEEGSHSGAVLRFANSICEEFEDDYPDLYFQIFAYGPTKEAPLVTKAHINISVTFCYDTSCSNHPIDGSECVDGLQSGISSEDQIGRTNAQFHNWITGWSEICSSVYVWLYELDNGWMQYPVIDTILQNFKYLYNLGVIDGIFWQNQNLGYGISRIEYELCNQVFWNKDLTKEEYQDYYHKYMANEYGDGWEYIAQYIDILTKNCDTMGCWHCWGAAVHNQFSVRMDDHLLAEAYDSNIELFNKALELCNSEVQEQRILVLSIHMNYQGIFGSFITAIENGDMERIYELNNRYSNMIALAKSFKINVHNVQIYDGIMVDYEETLYEEAYKNWTNTWYDTIYRPLTSDSKGNILYNKVVVWDGTIPA